MAKLIVRLICAVGLLVVVGLTGAATAAAPTYDQPVTPPRAAAAPIVERMAGCRSSYRCYGLRKGCRVVRDPYPAPIGFAAPRCDGGDPVLRDQ
jgi:hypothetical protein